MMKNLEVGILSTGLANENCSTDNLNYELVFLSTQGNAKCKHV